MKNTLVILFLVISIAVSAVNMEYSLCRKAAENKIKSFSGNYTIRNFFAIDQEHLPIAYVFELEPFGYIITTASDLLPPIIAYSYENNLSQSDNSLIDLVAADVSERLENIEFLSENTKSERKNIWKNLISGNNLLNRPEQWPPEGYSPTGGWLPENWSQSAPYNGSCPIDPVSGARSLAGCPSLAMASILNYHRTTNDVIFNDDDDYYHNYAGRQFWIDDDYSEYDFLSFPQMNSILDSLNYKYLYDIPVVAEDKAALVFACGVAATQVYTSQGSGTFGVSQAYDAYQKFNFSQSELIDDTNPDFWEHIIANIMNAMPVHLATVTPQWDSGHNFVVDGYNTDNYFHCNYGWGGGSNGWYLLPNEIPYNLTVIEGAVVDIIPAESPAGFIDGYVTLSPLNADSLIAIEIESLSNNYFLNLIPNESGITPFIHQVQVGSYTVTATYPGYTEIYLNNIVVNEFQTTSIDFTLCEIINPQNLAAELSGNIINLTWQHNDINAESYHIFRNINGTAFNFLASTNEHCWADQITSPLELTYGYYVKAIYEQENESEPSNYVYVDYFLENTNNQIANAVEMHLYPNPFNPQTEISFSLENTENIELDIYNLKGKKVRSLLKNNLPAGYYSVVWNGKNDNDKNAATGIYLVKLKIGDNQIISRKCLLLK